MKIISDARVPIIKFRTCGELAGIEVDVSVNSSSGPLGAVAMKAMLERMEVGDEARVTALVLMLKLMLKNWKLGEVRTGGLGGRAVFCMATAYIQLNPAAASCSTVSDLIGFLHFYAFKFDHHNLTLCTTGYGSLVPKDNIGFGSSYSNASNCRRGCRDSGERLSIQHPVDPTRDLTAGSYQFGLIKSAFTDTLADLVNFPSLPTAITLNHSFFTSSTLTTYINDGYSSSSVTITLKNLHTSLSCSSSFSPESHESSLTTVPNSIQSSPKEVSTSNTLYKIGLYLQPELIEKRTFINNVWEEGGVAILVND